MRAVGAWKLIVIVLVFFLMVMLQCSTGGSIMNFGGLCGFRRDSTSKRSGVNQAHDPCQRLYYMLGFTLGVAIETEVDAIWLV